MNQALSKTLATKILIYAVPEKYIIPGLSYLGKLPAKVRIKTGQPIRAKLLYCNLRVIIFKTQIKLKLYFSESCLEQSQTSTMEHFLQL